MTCEQIERELVAYHFGVCGDRALVEQHLPTCGDCLQSFIELKRAIETGTVAPEPSPAVLDRLRVTAAQALGSPARRPWSWWERPLALACGGLVTLAALLAVSALATGAAAPPRGHETPAAHAAQREP